MNFLVSIIETYPVIFLVTVMISSLLVMILSSDKLLFGITRWAKHLGLSDYMVGMVIVALAASLPEFAASVMGLGDIGIIFGTVIGSNLGGLTLLLGAMGMLSSRIPLHSKLFSGLKILILLIVALPFVFVLDGTLGRIDGVILVTAYLMYLYFVWRKEGELGSIKKNVHIKHIWKSGLIFLLALVALLLSARWLINTSELLARVLSVPKFVVVVFVIGIGAQIPDLIVVIRSQLKHHGDVGIGDLLGSTIVKALLFLGLISIIQPLSLADIHPEEQLSVFRSMFISGGFFMLAMFMLMLFMHRGYMKRWEGICMFLLYFVYAGLQVMIL